MRNTKIFCCIFILLFVQQIIAQSNEEALRYVQAGMKLIDEGKYDEAIVEINKGVKLEPKNSFYKYELALAYFYKKDYDEVIDILEKAKKYDDVNDQVYSVLGNAYDVAGNREEAIKTYKAGLKKFPNSGKIYLELGVVAMSEKEYEKALEYFEKGIEGEPTHPSNYYWASIFYASSNVKLWGLIYGEIFLNLEPGTKRSEKISKMMYMVYNDAIKVGQKDGKKNIEVKLNSNVFNMGDLESSSFAMNYEMAALFAAFGAINDSNFTGMDIKSISKLRENFITIWFENEKTKDKSNVLFDYQKSLYDAGLLEAYNYFLCAYGDTDEFNKWVSANKNKVDEFDKWYNTNPLKLTKENSFYRKNSK